MPGARSPRKSYGSGWQKVTRRGAECRLPTPRRLRPPHRSGHPPADPVRPCLCLKYNGSRDPIDLTYEANFLFTYVSPIMSKLLRGLVAGYGAKKLGGGCFSTVLVFLLLWWLLGYCNGMQ